MTSEICVSAILGAGVSACVSVGVILDKILGVCIGIGVCVIVSAILKVIAWVVLNVVIFLSPWSKLGVNAGICFSAAVSVVGDNLIGTLRA